MKYKDYKFTTSSESMNLTYDQACEYFEETLELIEKSQFDLFNDEEELSLEDARKKYNEINRRLQTFGQSFELFMKYIIHASRIEKNPNITIDELWNKWIRGHQMVPLINEKANSSEVLPNFKEIFNLALNSCYGIYGFNYIQQLGIDAVNGIIEPIKLFAVLQPHNYNGMGSITDEEIEEIIEKNTAIYEKCRYNVEKMTNYNFTEVFYFISFIKFFAKMIHISNDKTEIDYNVAYVHAMADDPIIKQILLSIRTEKEISEILNNDFCNQNAKLLTYLLIDNTYSIDDIKEMQKMNKELENPNNLYILLTYHIPMEYIKECNEKNMNVMLLASDFTFKQIEQLVSIPIVGDYLNKNSILANKMITKHKSDIGLNFEDWYKLLNREELKDHPEIIKDIIIKYREVYHSIEKNKLCNQIFTVAEKDELIEEKSSKGNNQSFSQRYSDELISNISNNIVFFEKLGINYDKIPLSLDSENIRKIYKLLDENYIKYIPTFIFACPFNEVFSIIYYMKENNYDLSSNSFPTDFWKVYDAQSKYNMMFQDSFVSDEFMEQNGLKRIKNSQYSNEMYGKYVSANNDNPLPNLKK